MIFSTETIDPQIDKLLHEYPNLTVVESDSHSIRLSGDILVFRVHNDFTLRKTYMLEVVIPIGTMELPYAIDIGKQIMDGYPHIYLNRKLCLATDSQMRIRFVDGFDLVLWMSEFVEVYYLSYEYYQRYNVFPFGECDHGLLGVLQTYQDCFQAKDAVEAHRIMQFVKNKKYRGHHPCPCKSGNPLRSCHGHAILPFFQDKRLMEIMADDLFIIDKELANQHERNNAKAK